MNYTDNLYKKNIKEILSNGVFDDGNVRTVWEDGSPAHTKFITQVCETYDIDKGEFPLSRSRRVAWKSAINEILAIYQTQTNTREGFQSHNISWWEPWIGEDGTIGRSYAYNLESHRHKEQKRELIKVDSKIFTEKDWEKIMPENVEGLPSLINHRKYCGIGYLGDYGSVKNFSEEQVSKLLSIWEHILYSSYSEENSSSNSFVCSRWHCFKNFLTDVRYIPQYHLAKEDNFSNWTLDKNYFNSNMYGPDSCAFLQTKEILFNFKLESALGDSLNLKKELSRNQINELIKGLKENPNGRRHITSFWNWANIDKKNLVECAFQTMWSVRGDFLDLTLIQRSSDYLTAGHINKIQYVALQMMIAKATGYKPGKFTHFVQSLHIYDRHFESAEKLLERFDEIDDTQPKLILTTDNTDFYSFTIDDFTVEDYVPIEPQIKLEIAL